MYSQLDTKQINWMNEKFILSWNESEHKTLGINEMVY